MNKLSYENKINLYNDRKKHMSISATARKYRTSDDNVQYLERLIDKHGFEILNAKKHYNDYEKEQIINRVINGETIISVAIDEGIKSKSMLSHWVQKYKENGYNIVERKRGRSIMPKLIKRKQNETLEEENERLRQENLYLKAKLEYSKKLRAVVQTRKNQQQKKK